MTIGDDAFTKAGSGNNGLVRLIKNNIYLFNSFSLIN